MAANFGSIDRRSQSQIRHEFPSFHSSHRTSNPPPPPPLHSTHRNVGQPPPAPYSSTSLGPNFRSRSLDHRRFPAFTSEADQQSGVGGQRTIYTSQQIGGIGGRQKFTGELFGGVSAGKVANSTGSTHYRSSSTEKSGVTIVPIRREATLPARRFQSEWKSEWKGGVGGGGFGGPSLIQQQIAEQQQKEEEEGAKEEYQFERSSKFSQNRQAWNKPREHFHDRWHRMEMIEAPKSVYYPTDSTVDYSMLRRNQQMAGDTAAQHQQNQQHTRTQKHERQYREWHSGGERHHRSAAAGGTADHYGTLGTRRSATERHGHRGTGYQYREGAYGVGGGGGHRYQNYRQHEQQQYANGWTGGGATQQQYYHQQHMRRSASAGEKGGGLFGTGRKSKSSKSSGARWSNQRTMEQRGPKRYRKIRFCCFNLIWPPWAVEPSGPPRPYYGRNKASGPPTPIPLEHRPFYAPTAEGPIPPQQQAQPINPEAIPNEVPVAGGGYPRGPPGVPEPPEYRAPPREYQGGGMDVPDYRRGEGERMTMRHPQQQQQYGPDAQFQHSNRELGRELPVRHEQPPPAENRWSPPRRGE